MTNMGALMREGDACIGRKVKKCKKGFSGTANVMEALAFLDLAPLFLSMVAVRRKMEHSCVSTEHSDEQQFEGRVAVDKANGGRCEAHGWGRRELSLAAPALTSAEAAIWRTAV